jgi:hypothetical protein
MMEGQGKILNKVVPESNMKITAGKPCVQLVTATQKLITDFGELHQSSSLWHCISLENFGSDWDRRTV